MNVLSLFDGISCGQQALKELGIVVDNFFASEINPTTIKITQHRHPNTIQLGDINGWENWKLPDIDVIMGGSPCFAAGNLVMTENGYKPIESLIVGDKVLTHKNRFKKIIKTGNDYKNIFKIKSQGSTEILTTKNHPFLSRKVMAIWENDERSYNITYTNLEWETVEKLTQQHKLTSIIWGTTEDAPEFTDTDLYILGRFLADGCCYKTKRNNRRDSYIYKFKISVGKHELEDFKNKVDDRFSYVEERTVVNAFIYRKKWVEIGELFGKLAHNKFIPNFILDLPVERLKIFIKGYMDGDGCLRPNNYVRNTTVSKKLALTLSLAIQKCYHGVSINFTKRPKKCIIESREVNQRDTYSVTFSREEHKHSKYFIDGEHIFYNFKKENINLTCKVYNIEVEDDNSYIVNNLIVHNCQGFSHAGQGLNFKDPRSMLFFKFVDVWKHYSPKWFLLENVRMKKEWQNVISDCFGIDPYPINSNVVVPQNRNRLYWTNIKFDPFLSTVTKKTILDILQYNVSEQYYLTKRQLDALNLKEFNWTNNYIKKHHGGKHQQDTIYRYDGIMACLSAATHGAARHLTKTYLPDGKIRRLTEIECERLQGLPDNYTEGSYVDKIASSNRYEALGNCWTVPVIKRILSGLIR